MKKRVLAILLLVIMLCATACGKETKLYNEAVKALQENELKLDGSNEMSEELLVAINNAEYTEPKSIIFMIGDGMGHNIIEATQTVYAEQLYQGKLAISYLPMQSTQTTYSTDNDVTDSAAGGTALSTGIKTKNSVIAMNLQNLKPYETNLELAATKGKSTGIVVTASVTDATPATFTSHVYGREQQEKIAAMQLKKLADGSLDLALGAGTTYYESQENETVLAQAKKAGMTYTTKWEETMKAELPVVGLYGAETLDTADEAVPSLAVMTNFALEKLSEDEDGFFLMVEGSQIDDYGEYNNLEREMKEMYDFDCAVAVAMRYVALHPDTALIITADHDTGDLEIPADATKEDILSESTYSTNGHMSKTIPVFAVGYQTEKLSGILENTDIGVFTASLLDGREVEATGKKVTLSKEIEQVTYNAENVDYVIDLSAYSKQCKEITQLRTFHVKVTNPTEKTLPLPVLTFEYDGETYSVKPQKSWIKAGESVDASYVIPNEAWKKNALADISKFVLTLNGLEGKLEYSSIQLGEYTGKK